MKTYYIEERQPSGKYKRSQHAYTTHESAEKMKSNLEENGCCGKLRVVEVER